MLKPLSRSLFIATILQSLIFCNALSPRLAEAQSNLPPCSSDTNVALWSDCQGTANLYGTIYVGEFRRGLPDGRGSFKDSKGRTYYDGEFKENMLQGYGVETNYPGENTDLKTYAGGFKKGAHHGQGTATFRNGEKYEGQWKYGVRDGVGTQYAVDGSIKQAGTWKYGKFLGAAQVGIPVKKIGGTYIVPVHINGAITLDFTIDSGASDVSIPSDVVSTLIRSGSIKASDFTGMQTYQLADGSTVPSATFTIRSLTVGDKRLENVRGSVASANGSLLLGQSFLTRFKSWSIDNDQQMLILKD